MKTPFFAAILAAVLLCSTISCTKNNDTANPSIESLEAQYKRLSTTPATETGSFSDTSKSFITGIDTRKLNLLNQIRPMGVQGWVGPNFITGALRLIAVNQNLTITNSEAPSLPTGVYVCDVYALSAEVTLPSDAVARIELASMTKYGYSNWTTRTRGVLYNQAVGPTGNVVGMTTFSILPKYNILGQQVNAPAIPAGDLTGVQFAYSYFQ